MAGDILYMLKELKHSHNFDTEKKKALLVDEQKLFVNFLKKNGQYNHCYPIFAVTLDTVLKVLAPLGMTLAVVPMQSKFSFAQSSRIPKNEERSFNVGYLFLQHLCPELRLGGICRKIRSRYKFTCDFHAILTDLIYVRILSPSSKLGSYAILFAEGRLLEEIWDTAGDYVNDNTLTVYTKRLRDKIEDEPANPKILKTVRGIGYILGE